MVIDKNNASPKSVSNSTDLNTLKIVEKRSVTDLLPPVHQTTLMKKFFGNTGDHLFQPEQSEILTGFIGQIPTYADLGKDFYIHEPTKERANYQLEPTVVSINKNTGGIDQTLFYEDIVNLLRFQGGITENHDRMFNTEYYSWAPPITFDKFLNFQNYAWLPNTNNTPEAVLTSATPDYMVMEKGSLDGNPWSSRNQWFHYNALTEVEKQTAIKATRPIIEFIKDLELFNYGITRRDSATVKDDITTDPKSLLGATSLIVDGITLVDGDTILFTNNSIEVLGNWDLNGWDLGNNPSGLWDAFTGLVYSSPLSDITLKIHTGTGDGIIESASANFSSLGFTIGMAIHLQGTDQDGDYIIDAVLGNSLLLTAPFPSLIIDSLQTNNITIIENVVNYKDRIFEINGIGSGITLSLIINGAAASGFPVDGESILITSGTNNGSKEFYWNDGLHVWNESQTKIFRNTPPLFQLYDSEGVKLQDPEKYPNSTFSGNKIFNYQVNPNINQTIDSELDLRATFDQFGDFEYENFIVTNRTSFNIPSEEIMGYYFHRAINNFSNDWHRKINVTKQFVTEDFVSIENKVEYELELLPELGNDITIFINAIALANTEYSVTGKIIIFNNPSPPKVLLRIRYYSTEIPIIGSNVVYEIPLNLEANPDNQEIKVTSRSKFFDHITEIISNQSGLIGNPNGVNNYYELTNVDYSLGNQILQHSSPMLKLMAIGSTQNTDFMLSVRFVEREYSRFKNKFLKKIETFQNSVFYNETINQDVSLWVNDAISAINLGKTDTFPFHNSGMGILDNGKVTYIPPSPSRLGVYPVFKPDIYIDTTYGQPHSVIQLHDGSILIAYDDFRDSVILEYENRIYDNIPSKYKTDNRPDFDLSNFVESQFRNGEYSIGEFNKLLMPIISRWAAFSGMDIFTNDIYNLNDPFTYNYSSLGLPGYWRGIYKLFYDTDRPNTHPWEMFGFTSEPVWWVDRYGSRPYKSNNSILWRDVATGFVANGERAGIDLKYARPTAPIPVNASGELLDPVAAGLTIAPGQKQAQAFWEVGDHGPVETVFRRSEFWSFAIAQISYLMKPTRFIEMGWDSNATLYRYLNGTNPQWLNDIFNKRSRNINEVVHGELQTDGTVYLSNGIQQWITDWAISNGRSITASFGDTIRGIDTKLGHKMAGFINTSNNQFLADNLSGPIPNEDANVILYKNPSIREEFYGGVVIEKDSDGWIVSGYDALNGKFFIFPGILTSKKIKVLVGFYDVKECTKFNMQSPISVPYGTKFKNVQDVYNFLIGYGKFLESRGWIFDDFESDTNETRDWKLAGKQFLFWAQGNWHDGSVITLSPSSQKVKFKTPHGEIQSIEQVINGVYSLLNRDGSVLQPRDTFVNRNGDEIVILPDEHETIFTARLFIAENEHVIIFNNTTIFNDLIYDQLYSLRQSRLRVITTRTLGWAGRIDAPGYFVTGNTLTPNIEKSVNDFRHLFDIENQVNRSGPKLAAQHNIGFQSRDYLNTMLISPLTQFEFYQGFIRNKGTPTVLNTLLRSDIASGSDEIQFFEEWAFKLGSFGATSDFSSAELNLQSAQINGNPQLIEFTSSRLRQDISSTDTTLIIDNVIDFPDSGIIKIVDELIQYGLKNNTTNELLSLQRGVKNTIAVSHGIGTPVGIYDNLHDDSIIVSPNDKRWNIRPEDDGIAVFNLRNTPLLFANNEAYRNENAAYYQRNDNRVAGYVKETEVKFRVKSISERNDLIDQILQDNVNSAIIEFGDQIWVDNIRNEYLNSDPLSAFNFGFQVYNIIEDTSVTLTGINTLAISDGDPITLNITGTWTVGDLIIIGDTTGTAPSLNGIHEVIGLNGLQPVIQLSITDDSTLSALNTLYKFTEARFLTFSDIINSNFDTSNGIKYSYIDTRPALDEMDLWEVYKTTDGVTWTAIRKQELLTDSRSFKESLIFNNLSKTIDIRLHIFDPAKGLYPGQSASEIDFKLEYDPAKYNKGDKTRFQIDLNVAWGEPQVGSVWWDLSQVEYEIYETGTNRERRNQWGRLAPGKSIDVYEWVRSPVPPAQWSSLVLSTSKQPAANFDYKPSGEAFFGEIDSGPYTEQRLVNPISGVEQIFYYFWIKNSDSIPNINQRERSVARISRELADPTSAGIPWFAPINNNALIISNVQTLLSALDSMLQINYNFEMNKNNAHTEWLLLKEGSKESNPSNRLWIKMRDSLTGMNNLRHVVPDPKLEDARKYGNSIRPRQSWFVDNEAAARIFIDKANEILVNEFRLDTEGVAGSLNVKTAEPTPYGTALELVRLIDICEFDDPFNLEFDLDPSSTSQYHVADLTERNNLLITGQATLGQQIYVDGVPENRSFWSVYKVINTTVGANIEDSFELTCNEAYRLSDFWETIDYYAVGFSIDTIPTFIIDTLIDRDLLTTNIDDIALVNDTLGDGSNIWALYQKVLIDGFISWNLIGRKNGTIKFITDLFFDATYGNNDRLQSTNDFPTGTPGRMLALESAINSLRDITLTKLGQNNIFFSMINYVHSEQLLVDWVFKTTYISSLGLNRNITQDQIFSQDRTENFIKFIEEARPYHTILREFRIQENFGVDIFNGNITDFDKPVYFDDVLQEFRVLDPSDPNDILILSDINGEYIDWYNNYLANPELIRQMKTTIAFDRISCGTSGGWDPLFGWDTEANESWDLDFSQSTNAADRIVQFYIPQPNTQDDIIAQNIDEFPDLTTLISGCDFKSTILNSGRYKDLLQETIGGWGDINNSQWSTIPWSPLGGISNVIDISEYDVIYDGGPSQFKSITQSFGNNSTVTFNINNFITGDVIAVFSDGNIQTLNDEYTLDDILGTITFNTPPILDALIQISVYSAPTFEEAQVTSLSDILVDGNLFKQPHIDNNHPEELILGAIGEAVSFKVDDSATGGDFRLFMNNKNSRISDNIRPLLRTTLSNTITNNDTTLEFNSTIGLFGGKILILSNTTPEEMNLETAFIRGAEIIEKPYSLYNPVTNTIDLNTPISNDSQINITVDGIEQVLGSDYTANLTNETITFLSVPLNTQIVKIRVDYKIGNILYNVIRGYDNTIALASISGDAVIFNDQNDKDTHAIWDDYRIKETTTLASQLNLGDTSIELSSVAGLPKQAANQTRMTEPGVIWIGSERIEFFKRTGTTLQQIVRGTQGTSIGVRDVYDTSGRLVTDYRSTTLYYDVTDVELSNAPTATIFATQFDFTMTGLVVGQKISFINNITLLNNGTYTVASITNNTLVFVEIFSGPTGPQTNEVQITFSSVGSFVMPAGLLVVNGSKKNKIPNGYEWFESTNGLALNTLHKKAKFING